MDNNQEMIDEYKKELLQNIRAEISETGSVAAYLQLMGTKKDLDKPVIVHIQTDFVDEDDKEFFVEEGIPTICKDLKKRQFTPICVSFVAEAWMRVSDSKDKKEVILINISTENGDDMYIYNIIRHPYEVDESGELKSKVELSEDEITSDKDDKPSSAGGRFSNLYQKFAKILCNK